MTNIWCKETISSFNYEAFSNEHNSFASKQKTFKFFATDTSFPVYHFLYQIANAQVETKDGLKSKIIVSDIKGRVVRCFTTGL